MRGLQGVDSVFHSCCASKGVIGDNMAVHGVPLEPDIPTRGGRMLHCSLLDSGVCVMHMFSSLDMALDIQSAARHWIHVVHVRAKS